MGISLHRTDWQVRSSGAKVGSDASCVFSYCNHTVQTSTVSGGLRVTLQPGGTQTADSGGVLLIGNSPTAAAPVYLPSVTQ